MKHLFLIFFLLISSSSVLANQCRDLFQRLNSALNHPGVRESIVTDDFDTWRDIFSYDNAFNILNHLSYLGPEHTWIDFGSGQGIAALDFLILRGAKYAPTVYGLTYSRPPFDIRQLKGKYEKIFRADIIFQKSKKFIPIEGRFVEDIPASEIPKYDLGSDFFGPLAYTSSLSEVLNIYLAAMRTPLKSKLLTLGLNLRSRSKESSSKTYIIDQSGQVLSLEEWLTRQPGLVIGHEKKYGQSSIVIKKKYDDVTLPHLYPVKIINGTPPTRVFSEVKPPIDIEKIRMIDPRDEKEKSLFDIIFIDDFLDQEPRKRTKDK